MSVERVDIELDLAAAKGARVVRCEIEEGISELTHAVVELASVEELPLHEATSGPAVLRVLIDGYETRHWTLVVGRARYTGIEGGMLRWELDLHTPAWLLKFTQNTRKFRDLAVEPIVSKVLTESGVAFKWNTTRATRSRPYTVQYHETNLDFVARLLEFEGIYYTCDAEGALVFADRSPAEPEVDEGGAPFELLDTTGALGGWALGILSFSTGASVSSGAVAVNDFDWKKPKTSLMATASGALDAELEVYDYPHGYREIADGNLYAKMRLEALRVPSEFVEGEATATSFMPARAFVFGAGVGEEFAGEYLITSVKHRLWLDASGNDGEISRTYRNSFHAIPRDVPFRAPLQTPRPKIAGHHTAMVRGPAGEEIHTDEHGRFKAQFHWDREATGTDKDSRWMRLLQESATSMTLARVGWEVNVGYVDGDPDRPIGLARDINGQMIPTYGQPSNKTMMTVQTPTYPGGGGYNEWRMNDVAGSMTMDVRAERDLSTEVQNDRSETVGNDVTHTVLAVYNRTVGGQQKVDVGSNQKVTSAADRTLAINTDRSVIVGGSETIKVKDGRHENVQGDDSEKVGSVRLTIAGSFHVNLPDPKALLSGMVSDVAQGAIDGAAGAVGGAGGQLLSGAANGFMSGGASGAASGAVGALGGGPVLSAAAGGLVSGGASGALSGAAGALGGPGGAIGAIAGLAGGGARGGPGAGPGPSAGGPGPEGGGAGPEGGGPGQPAGAGQGLGGGSGADMGLGDIASLAGLSDSGLAGAAGKSLAAIGGPGGSSFFSNLGGASSAFSGLASGAGISNALSGAVSGAGASLQNMIDPSSIASKLTGGLSDGITVDKLIDNFTQGGLTRSTSKTMSRTVGGAFITVAVGPINTSAAVMRLETIGGVKLVLAAKGGISEEVGGYLALTVGAAIIRTAKGQISYAAEVSNVKVRGPADMSSDKQLELMAKKIHVEAKLSLDLHVGDDLRIKLTPGNIKLQGKVKLEPKDKLESSGLPIDLTEA